MDFEVEDCTSRSRRKPGQTHCIDFNDVAPSLELRRIPEALARKGRDCKTSKLCPVRPWLWRTLRRKLQRRRRLSECFVTS